MEETLTTIATAKHIFANAPTGTKVVELTAYGGTFTVTYRGIVPVEGSVGSLLPVGLNSFHLHYSDMIQLQAISSTVTSIYICYFGVR